ncbi:MAG: response regulator transcription factor, partial [Beijerinckiaceae bacterium]
MLNTLQRTKEIFVVDDDVAVRDAVSMALRAEGYIVENFADATALLEVVRMRAPAAIILDVMLPDKSGIDILKLLRNERYPAPVVLITGHGDIPMAVEAIKQGAYDFVEKPVPLDALLNLVKGAVSRQG